MSRRGASLLTPSQSASSARSRRRNADSSEDSERGEFGISNRMFCVVAPPSPPLPLESDYHDEVARAIVKAFGREIDTKAGEVFVHYGISWDDEDEPLMFGTNIISRSVPGQPWTAQPTLFIVAPWTRDSPQQWQKVVATLKRFVDSLTNNPDWKHVSIAVEMVGAEMVMQKYSAPVVGNHKLEQEWPAISDMVLSILESFSQTRSHTTSISLFHLGYKESAHLNPVTVYISVDYDCSEDAWPPVLGRIQQELDKAAYGLVAHIEYNEIEYWAFPLLPPTNNELSGARDQLEQLTTPYDNAAHLGANVGTSLYLTRDDGKVCCPGYGTLECYVEILRAGNAGWETFALTNYHVIRPAFPGFMLKAFTEETRTSQGRSSGTNPEAATQSIQGTPEHESDLWRCDVRGFGPSTTRPSMESPSRYRHNCHVSESHSMRNDLSGADDFNNCLSEIEATLEQKLQFFDQNRHHLGRVWAGSGLAARTPDGPEGTRRLDWALIDVVENRRGTNQIPDVVAWLRITRSNLVPHSRTLRSATNTLGQLTSGKPVYKVGSASGATVGYFNRYKSVAFIKHDRHLPRKETRECMVMGKQGAIFAKPGDSGSVVFTELGEAVGLVFTGVIPQQSSDSHTLVTPLEDVFDHIKKISGGKIREVRVA